MTASIRFDDLPWQTIDPFARQKTIDKGDRVIRLLEFQPGFEEAEFCTKGHIGFVVNGSMQIQFADRIESFRKGDAIYIEAGEEGRHKAVVSAEPVTLLLVEDKVESQ